MKRKISKQNMEFMKSEMSSFEGAGLLSPELKQQMLSMYEVKDPISLIRVLLVIGAILMGIGIVGFIAGDWTKIPHVMQFFIILIGWLGFNVAGYRLKNCMPKTSHSMYYLGTFVFGAGVVFFDEILKLKMETMTIALLLLVGTLPVAVYLKDKRFMFWSIMLMGWYAGTGLIEVSKPYPYALFILLPLMYWLNDTRGGHSRANFFLLNSISIYLLAGSIMRLNNDLDKILIPLILVIIGVVMTTLSPARYKNVILWQGTLLYGGAGMFMTLRDYWVDFLGFGWLWIVGSLLLGLFALYQIKKGSLPAVLVVCGLVFRLYVDYSYHSLPKSLFFIIGGIILMGCGYWFEKKRNQTV